MHPRQDRRLERHVAGLDVVGPLYATKTEFGQSSVKWSLPKAYRPR
jgi:hypothetical protein